jgi:hypothetical protein
VLDNAFVLIEGHPSVEMNSDDKSQGGTSGRAVLSSATEGTQTSLGHPPKYSSTELNFGRLRERGWRIVLRSPRFTTFEPP